MIPRTHKANLLLWAPLQHQEAHSRELTELMLAAGKGALWKASHREIEATDEEVAAVWKAMEAARTAALTDAGPQRNDTEN